MALDMSKVLAQKTSLENRLNSVKGSSEYLVPFWVPKIGKNKFRIMPGWDNNPESRFNGQFWREVVQHWGVSHEVKVVVCTNKTPGMEGSCPVCELEAELRRMRTDVAAQQRAKDIRAKTAYFLNVIDLSDPTYTAADVADYKASRPEQECPFGPGDAKVQIYSAPSTVFQQILSLISENDTDFSDPNAGHDLTMDKNGSGQNVKYTVTPIMKPSACKYYTEDMKLPDLTMQGRSFPYEELKLMLESGDSAPASSAGGGNNTVKKLQAETKPALKAAKQVAPADDDDDIQRRLQAALADD